MGTSIVKAESQQLQESQFGREQLELIKATVAKGTTDDEFKMFIQVCRKTGLDPFTRQIHAVKRWDSSQKREVMAIQTGIDGYRLIADRTERYAPGRETDFKYKPDGTLLSATAYVKKLVAGTWHEISSTAFYDEYAQHTKDGEITKFWREKGHIMLSKCAEALALRKAFPAELSGVYTHEEMQQADVAAPIEHVDKKPGGHVYRTELMGKALPAEGHCFEMGSHTYCHLCERAFNALPQKERTAFADAFTNWMKTVDAVGESIPMDIDDVNPPEQEPDWGEYSEVEAESAASTPQLSQLPNSGPVISEPQSKRFYAIAKSAGWGDAELKQYLSIRLGVESSKLISKSAYEQICTEVQKGMGVLK